MKKKGIVLGVVLVMLLVLTSGRAQAQCCDNPLFLPFAVAGAIVGTAAAITTAIIPGPFYPAYHGPGYGPPPGYHHRYGPGPVDRGPGWGGGPRPPHGPWDGGPRW